MPQSSPYHARYVQPLGQRDLYLPVAVDSVNTTKKVSYAIITSDLLIPGDGQPIPKGALVVEQKIIVWLGTSAEIPAEYTSKPHRKFHVPYMMPGLWDCHTHFSDAGDVVASGAAGLTFIAGDSVGQGARLARGCWEAIQRGYTSLRDLAGFGCEIATAIDEGVIIGPNIYSAGAALSQTAGHGDIFALPAGDALGNLGVNGTKHGYSNVQMTCLVDGADECRRGVRLQIRRGAKCIKVLASGGVLSRDDNPLYAQFCKEELDAIVEESSRMERTVAAHCHGKPGIVAAVRAGVTSIEHGTFIDEECADLMIEKDILLVATRTIVDALVKTGGKGLPPSVWKKVQLTNANHLKAYQIAIKKGVTIALGTDTGPGYNMAVELQFAVEAGMSNLEAIKAATATAPRTVKGQAPLSGQLKVGYEADILGILENPVDDVKVLQKRENINWVWKGGRLLKGPGVGPWGEDDHWVEDNE